MDQTSTQIMKSWQKFAENATKDQKRVMAMYLIYNMAMDTEEGDTISATGLLDTIKAEMHEEFTKDALSGKYKFGGIIKN